VGLIVLCLVTLFTLSRMPGAGKMHASIEIAASPQQLWPWLIEGDKLKQWVSWLTEVRQTEPSALGATQTWVMKDENNGGAMMSIAGRYAEFNPPNRMTIAVATPDFDGAQTYVLKNLGNGHTRFEIDGEYRFSQWFAKLMTPLIMPSATSKLERDIAHLKSLAESLK
jgi:uncharacterized protein YndB with AHSA1/START domain